MNLLEEYEIYVTVEKMLNVTEIENYDYWLNNIWDGKKTEVTDSPFSHNLVWSQNNQGL